MDYNQICILLLEGSLVAFLILLLFRLRKRLGIGVLFACLGLFQFVQVFLSSTVYVSIADGFTVSPGSAVFFTATLFILLIMYIKEDTSEIKKLIYTLFIINIVMSILLRTLGLHFDETSKGSTAIFNINAWVLFVGTIALFLDSLLIIVIFEFISKKVRFLFLQIFITMLIVVSFDTLFFSILGFWNDEKLQTIITSGLISKGVFALFYSILFYFYIKYFDFSDKELVYIKIKDVFKPLSYKQKFESAVSEIIKVEEERKLELINSNKEKEKRIEELKDSQEKIKTSLELLEKSEYSKNEGSKIAKIGYWEHDLVTDTVVWSDYLYHIFESNPKEEIPSQDEIITRFDNESQVKLAQATLDITSKGINYDIELKFVNLKNEAVWLRNVAQPIYNQQNEIVGKRGVMQNITDSKKAQHQLELSKQKIQTSLELLAKKEYSISEASKIVKIGFFEEDIATETRIWSDYLYHIFGHELKDQVPTREEIAALMDEESQQRMWKSILDLDLKGIPFDVEAKITNLRNEELWLRIVAQPIYNHQNKIVGRRGVLQDITEQKIIKEQNLRITENYKKLFDNATFSIWNEDLSLVFEQIQELKKLNIPNVKIYFNENPQILSSLLSKIKVNVVNKATLKLFKAQSNQGFLENIQDTFGEGASKVFGGFIEAIWNNEKIFISEINYKTLEGDEFAAMVSIPIPQTKIEQSTVPVSIQSIQSIKDAENERKEALNILKTQSKFITAMTENQPAGIIACDFDGNLVLFNTLAKEWHGIDALEISQDKWAENYGLFKIDGKTMLKKDEIPLVEAFNGKKITNVEIVIKAKNQKPRIVICNGTSFFDATGDKLGALIVMNDITERKLIEDNLNRSQSEIKRTIKELERSEFLLNESGRLAKVGAWEFELASQKIRWSDQVFKIHGIPLGVVPPLDECISFYIDGSDKILTKAIEESISEKKKFDLVLRFKNKQNQKLWINSIGYPLTNESGEITSIIGVFQDITQQKIRQNKLDAQNEKLFKLNNALNEAQEISKLGSWEYISETDIITWSKELYNILGFSKEMGSSRLSEHKNFYTEESFIRVNEAVANCVNNEIPYNIELDVYTSNGSLKHIILRGRVLKDINKKVIGCYGTAQDITEEKQIRLKIEKAEEMYRLLTDNSNDLICLQELDSTFKYISPSIKNILGYEQSDFLGKKVFNIVHPDDIESLKDGIKQNVFSGSLVKVYSFRIRHKEGHFVWLEFLSSPVYKDKKISYFVTSARDVTQRVLAKQKIQEYQISLQKMTTEMTLIEEKQKKEIASNIHDHLSQSLVISKMKINELKKNSQLEIIDEDLNFIEKHISEALENSRKITYELSPPVLYQLGIIDALNWLLENVEATHKIDCKIKTNVDNINLNDVEAILLYRSIQEVLTNVIKYANASLIILNLDKNKRGLNIIITDNGVGFDTTILTNNQNQIESGFGLFTVQERIKNIQGNFTITSKINAGTTVNIFIPLSI